MKGRKTKTEQAWRGRPAVLLLSTIVAAALVSFASGQEPVEKQQRPRRVAGAENKSTGAQNPATVEEVGEGDVVRVDTQLVSVPAIVTNTLGHPVGGLRQDNFIVYEDGQKQSIANFGTTEAPFEIALLLDTSGSTRADVDLIRQAANAFIGALRPGTAAVVITTSCSLNTAASNSLWRL